MPEQRQKAIHLIRQTPCKDRDSSLGGKRDKTTSIRWIGLMLLLLTTTTLNAMEALVDSDWLAANRLSKGLYLLDIQSPEYYRRAHIVDAVNAPYAGWRETDGSGLSGMLPSVTRLQQKLGELGIDERSPVVIVATGGQAGDMAAASRVFWTLKAMGHGEVAVLNGGLVDYANGHAGDLEATVRHGTPTRYTATPDKRLVASAADVAAGLQEGAQLLDARTLGEYTGVLTGDPGERPGTLPGARHLPFDWLVDNRGRLRDKAWIRSLFTYAGADPDRDGTLHFCHTGSRAALNWFVDYAILGNRNAKLYDASMSEWSRRKALPMETRFPAEGADAAE